MKQVEEYRRMAHDLVENGKDAPNDMREILDYHYTINAYDPWFALTERKLNVPFIAREMLWYLNGDMEDDSIAEYAGVWRSVLDHDGMARSNYGYRAFTEGGLARAAHLLKKEPATRRAMVYFGDDQWVYDHDDVKDQPCANSIHWMIRGGKVHTIISQRSQDFIYGVSGDAIIMSIFSLVVSKIVGLPLAPMKVQVASFHHYPKHKEMVQRLVRSDTYKIDWPYPLMTSVEATLMANERSPYGPFMEYIAGLIPDGV